jgi:putative hydrolase of the HAD superfamily
MRYRYLFFDLDKTLYDFDTSTRVTFEEIFDHYRLGDRGIPSLDDFIGNYNRINLRLWKQYRLGGINKEKLRTERFTLTLRKYRIEDPELAEAIGHYYVTESPLKNTLFPGVEETLSYLQERYSLYIITNGFEEVQHKKLDINRLKPFFRHMITSEEAGCRKPDPGIFAFALLKAGAVPEESLMIGDDLEVDIRGARSVGMDQVFVNYERTVHKDQPTYEVFSFPGLKAIL